jgi:hypothetical protein
MVLVSAKYWTEAHSALHCARLEHAHLSPKRRPLPLSLMFECLTDFDIWIAGKSIHVFHSQVSESQIVEIESIA